MCESKCRVRNLLAVGSSCGLFLAGGVSATSCRTTRQDGTVTAKLRPTDWSRQGDPEGELEAFKVSPQAGPSDAACHVICGAWSHFVAFRQDRRLKDVDDLKADPASASCARVPTFAQVTRPSSRRTPISSTSLQGISTSTCTHKKRGAPDYFFCWLLPSPPILAGWSVATRRRRIDLPASGHQRAQSSAP